MRSFPKTSVILASAAALLCWRGISHAQLPGAVACPPGSPCDVFDMGDGQPDIFAQILLQDTATAQSVTTPLPNLPYTPIAPSFFANQQASLTSGVNGTSFCIDCDPGTADFLGWVPYINGQGQSTPQAHKTVNDMLTTAQNALSVSAAVSGTRVDTSGIAQEASSVQSLFGLLQIDIAAHLAEIDEQELSRLQTAALTTVEAAKMAEDVNTRAQFQAQSATNFWGME